MATPTLDALRSDVGDPTKYEIITSTGHAYLVQNHNVIATGTSPNSVIICTDSTKATKIVSLVDASIVTLLKK